jgi:hypothetical protein
MVYLQSEIQYGFQRRTPFDIRTYGKINNLYFSDTTNATALYFNGHLTVSNTVFFLCELKIRDGRQCWKNFNISTIEKKFLKSHPPQTAEPLETYFDASLRITKFMPFCVDRKSQKSSISL